MTNIVITGFIGTGKTAVGREVARQMGRPLVAFMNVGWGYL
jgi:shikimate kinase